MIYRFRVILDNQTDDDVLRDFEIRSTDTLEDLHTTIVQSFGFKGQEMASFYVSDDQWNQGEEISLFDLNEGQPSQLMNETLIHHIVTETQPKLIYIYDFLNLWTFYVELADIAEENADISYPNIIFKHGEIPEKAPEKLFETDDITEESDIDIDDYESLDF